MARIVPPGPAIRNRTVPSPQVVIGVACRKLHGVLVGQAVPLKECETTPTLHWRISMLSVLQNDT